jgi:hypothetical protein
MWKRSSTRAGSGSQVERLPNITLQTDEALACNAWGPENPAPNAVPRANACGASASQLNARVFDRQASSMTSHLSKDALLEEIDVAFQGVVLGRGVSLHETLAIDNYYGEEERLRVRAADERCDWHRLLLDPDLGALGRNGGPAFLDAEGMRFHLPALLILALRDFDAEEAAPALESMMYALTAPADDRLSLLTPTQRRCVGRVLVYIRSAYDLESEELDLAIERWLTS